MTTQTHTHTRLSKPVSSYTPDDRLYSYYDSVERYQDAGYTLMVLPAGSKIPYPKDKSLPKGDNGWDKYTIFPDERVKARECFDHISNKRGQEGICNFAIRTAFSVGGSEIVIMDIDCGLEKDGSQKQGMEQAERLFGRLGIEMPTPHHRTQSGGLHIIFKLSAQQKASDIKNLLATRDEQGNEEYKHIDIKCRNSYVVSPPSIGEDGDYDFYREDKSLDPVEMPDELWSELTKAKMIMMPGVAAGERPKISHKIIEKRLEFIPVVDIGYERWLAVGMAIHSNDPSDSSKAIWARWSLKDKKYAADADEVKREIDKKWKDFDASKGITIATLNEFAFESMRRDRRFVYYTDKDITIVDMETRDKMSVNTFGRMYGEIFGYIKNKSRLAERVINIEGRKSEQLLRVSGFNTWYGGDPVFEYDKEWFINSWRWDSMPVCAESEKDITDDARKIFKYFRRHIMYITGDKEYGEIVMRWIGHCVAKPGDKIKWALALLSQTQGTGKTSVVKMLALLLGRSNVSAATTEDIMNNFNSNSVGKGITNIEEFETDDKTRIRFATRVKA